MYWESNVFRLETGKRLFYLNLCGLKPEWPFKERLNGGQEGSMRNGLFKGVGPFHKTGLKAMQVERIKTGIPGLDELLDGGIPKGSLVVLSGDPGSGKTIFSLQFLYTGAMQHDEKGVLISLEEKPDQLIETASVFGWDFKKLVQEKKIIIQSFELYDFDKLRDSIEDLVTKAKAKRLVIDPGVIFRLYFERELDARKRIVVLGKMLKQLGVTTLVTNEATHGQTDGLFGLEEYVADGVILLYHKKLKNEFIRSVGVLKMRNTKIAEKLRPVRIDSKGIEVLARTELFHEI
ncbi:MAG: AAA family ATPase [Candidatus Diapherotrites archaeon]|nr:AAA family ATPase [Candidatus Diapherotrites archaeon]